MFRPLPPVDLTDHCWLTLRPAPEVWEWVAQEILANTGSIHNPEHAHLIDANIRVLWASFGFAKPGRVVLGQAEQVMFRAGGWQIARQEQQMREWFGEEPDYLITLAADYCAECSDAEFCALLEHELYHIAQKTDEYGAPKFKQDGTPSLYLKGHDVEEFVGVVRRYGASEEVQQLIDAASKALPFLCRRVADVGRANNCRGKSAVKGGLKKSAKTQGTPFVALGMQGREMPLVLTP